MGQVVQNLKEHTANGQSPITELYTNDYDHAGRLLKTKYKINDKPEVILNDMTETGAYDELGRLRMKKRHNGSDNESFDYNIRNCPTRITMWSQCFRRKLILYPNGKPRLLRGTTTEILQKTTWKYNGTINNYKYHMTT
jgi:hypothetical protein